MTRPPTSIGTVNPLFSPMRRLKKTSGVSLPALEVPPPKLLVAAPPNVKSPWPSRKNSRFSG
jgi:hypothetical protein